MFFCCSEVIVFGDFGNELGPFWLDATWLLQGFCFRKVHHPRGFHLVNPIGIRKTPPFCGRHLEDLDLYTPPYTTGSLTVKPFHRRSSITLSESFFSFWMSSFVHLQSTLLPICCQDLSSWYVYIYTYIDRICITNTLDGHWTCKSCCTWPIGYSCKHEIPWITGYFSTSTNVVALHRLSGDLFRPRTVS